jgi:thiol-disulfide isomerase/thioredoxin
VTNTEPAAQPSVVRRRRRRGVGPFSLRQLSLVAGILVIVALVITVLTAPLGTIDPSKPKPLPTAFVLGSAVPGLQVGNLAPELATDDGEPFVLSDLDGRPIRLADLKGRIVWLNFWASWCPPCQFETPTLREIDETYRDRGVTVVAVNVQETVESASAYAARYDWHFTVGADVSAAIFHAYRVYALPTQFIIDRDGILRQIVNGPLDVTSASQIFDALLAEVAPSGTNLSATP